VGTTEDPSMSRMTIVVEGDEGDLEQITKQLYKLIDTLKVFDLPADKSVQSELVLVKVAASEKNRQEITQIAEIYQAKIVDVAEKSMMLEITGDESKVEGAIKLLAKFGIKELVRTGRIALQRGSTE